MACVRGRWYRIAVVAAVSALTALAPAVPSAADGIDATTLLRRLEFLEDGATERSEIEARLGAPPSTYDEGRIASCAAELVAADGRVLVCPCPAGVGIKARFRLTLEYSPDGILKRHALVNRD